MTLPEIVAAAVAIFPNQVYYAETVMAITYFKGEGTKSFPEPLKQKLRDAARGATPIQPPKQSYRSIAASAAAVGR
jgi:hypothetical protein